MRYEKVKTWRGYEVYDRASKMYLERVYKGSYCWVSDYTYAMHYSEKTADKHLMRLIGKEN